MNRAQRRAAAREPDPRICEHGNPKKTDGNGEPMCPHGCGFVDKPVKRHRCCGNAASGQHRPTCPRRPTKRLRRRTNDNAAVVVLMPPQHGRPQTAVTKAIRKYLDINLQGR